MTRLPYLVTAVGGFRPVELSRSERIALRDALNGEPSDFVCQGIGFALNMYIETSRQQQDQSPEKVKNRVRRVLNASRELIAAISNLRAGDRMFLDKYWTFKEGGNSFDEKQVADIAIAFAKDIEQAADRLNLVERRGAMPAYPAQMLASNVANLLYLERGKFPACTRGRDFDRLLRAVLEAGNKRLDGDAKPRRDTLDLMKFAKERFDPAEAKNFHSMVLNWKKPTE